jgi:hypothetical protein
MKISPINRRDFFVSETITFDLKPAINTIKTRPVIKRKT